MYTPRQLFTINVFLRVYSGYWNDPIRENGLFRFAYGCLLIITKATPNLKYWIIWVPEAPDYELETFLVNDLGGFCLSVRSKAYNVR